ncbi:hypothetical protein B0O99DRAFT_628063 [Bisporella sp. PMI_857]|nr:hypothetical protein B0O99DRAFT_628063 [Bisporella sp. PMI_857]
MTNIRETEPIVAGKGCLIRVFIDEDKKKSGTPGSHWTEVSYDGEPDSLFEVPNHWHKYHDEYWTVLDGKFEAVINGKSRIFQPSDGEVHIPRRQVHGIKAIKGIRSTLKESTNPSGEFKEAFLRDLNQNGNPGFWLAMRVFYDGDTYPIVGTPFRIVDQAFVTVLGFIGKFLAPAPASNISSVAPH